MGIGTELKKIGRQLDPSSWKSEDWGKAALVGGLAYANTGDANGGLLESLDFRDPGASGMLGSTIGGTNEAVLIDNPGLRGHLSGGEGDFSTPGQLSAAQTAADGAKAAASYGYSPEAYSKLSASDRMLLSRGSNAANPWVGAGAQLGAAYIGAEATENSQRMMLDAAEERDKASANKLGLAQSAFTGGY